MQTGTSRSTVIDKVNIAEKLALFSERWSPKIIGEVNDFYIKVVKFQGEFVWHHHDNEDELFLVVQGRMTMHLRGREVSVGQGEFIVIPRGVDHMPVADEETHVVLVEPKTTLNTGNVRGERTLEQLDRL